MPRNKVVFNSFPIPRGAWVEPGSMAWPMNIATFLRTAMLTAFLSVAPGSQAAQEAAPAGASTHWGRTIFVSKLGDNSDGSSWAKAFTTIQAGLSAVQDERGNHRVIVRPDTYMEANLYPAYRGAPGAYNQLVGNRNSALGSGTRGWVVIDSGDAQKGFKSYDWWGPIRAYKKGWSPEHTAETFSAAVWDRWAIGRCYVTGGDGGLFFDLVDHPEPFSVRVEDCVGIGRAFGGGAANILSPRASRVSFAVATSCASTGGVMRQAPTCARSTPSCRPARTWYSRIARSRGRIMPCRPATPAMPVTVRVGLKNCRLISLNFSQPQGKPGTGVIFSTIEGKLLHVNIENCVLMGYKVFGAGHGEVSYALKGDVQAYVQFQQEAPEGMLRLGHWPVEVFQSLLPPNPPSPPLQARLSVDQPDLGDICEAAPVVWKDRLALMKCHRPATGGAPQDYFLTLEDVDNGRQLARFAQGYGLASALAHHGTLYVFASRFSPDGWNDVTLFKSKNLRDWTQKTVVTQQNEHLFNSSVCRGKNGFVMACESDDPKFTPFTIKFAVSRNLDAWTRLPDAIFGPDRYAACPCLRYVNGSYYLLYLEHRQPRWFFETYIARSKDLKNWELSPANPVLTPRFNDGVNASDPDLIEFHGRTYLYYSVGDQRTWSRLQRAVYPG